MPKKMGTKNVFIAVYVERPRRRVIPSTGRSNHHHHHYHHQHLHLHQVPKHGVVAGSSNRRAELLNYSQSLRNSAANSPANNHHQNKALSVSSYIQQPINQMMAAQSKRKHSKAPACMGSLKFMIPSFLQSSQGKKKKKKTNSSSANFTAQKAKTIMQSFQVHKNKGIFKKFLTAIQKYR